MALVNFSELSIEDSARQLQWLQAFDKEHSLSVGLQKNRYDIPVNDPHTSNEAVARAANEIDKLLTAASKNSNQTPVFQCRLAGNIPHRNIEFSRKDLQPFEPRDLQRVLQATVEYQRPFNEAAVAAIEAVRKKLSLRDEQDFYIRFFPGETAAENRYELKAPNNVTTKDLIIIGFAHADNFDERLHPEQGGHYIITSIPQFTFEAVLGINHAQGRRGMGGDA